MQRQLDRQKREDARLKSRFKEEARRLCLRILDLEEDLEDARKEKKKAEEQFEKERQEKEKLKSGNNTNAGPQDAQPRRGRCGLFVVQLVWALHRCGAPPEAVCSGDGSRESG